MALRLCCADASMSPLKSAMRPSSSSGKSSVSMSSTMLRALSGLWRSIITDAIRSLISAAVSASAVCPSVVAKMSKAARYSPALR